MSEVTLASWAIAVPVMRHSRTNATSLVFIVASFVRRPRSPGRTSDAGSGFCLRAAEPFVETDVAQAHIPQWHQRALLNAAAEVSGLGVTHDHTRVTERLQIAGDD